MDEKGKRRVYWIRDHGYKGIYHPDGRANPNQGLQRRWESSTNITRMVNRRWEPPANATRVSRHQKREDSDGEEDDGQEDGSCVCGHIGDWYPTEL